MRQISLALTHFNRFAFLLESLQHVIDDPRIGEVVISDDASTDGSYSKLVEHFKNNSKVKLFRNPQNLDCYFNKYQAVLRTTNEWVILFDSDNILTSVYLDVLYSLPEWDPDTVYCPDFAEPHFDYRHLAGKVVDRSTVSQLVTISPTPVPPRRRPLRHRDFGRPRPPVPVKRTPSSFNTALNTCNYFVNRSGYLGVWDGSINPHTADSILQAYNWLKAGKKIVILPGLHYFHRVHDGSHYKNNLHKTGGFLREVELKLKELR